MLTELLFLRCYQKYFSNKLGFIQDSSLFFTLACGPSSGLYYKHIRIVNYASRVVNKLEALLTDDARVVIYNRHVFIVQVTGSSTFSQKTFGLQPFVRHNTWLAELWPGHLDDWHWAYRMLVWYRAMVFYHWICFKNLF